MAARTPKRPVAAGALAALALLALAPPARPGPAVTVYSNDLGFVRETRTVELGSGRDTLRLTDVSRRLDFSSVQLDPGGGGRVERLAYRFDVASGDQLIENAIGQPVRVVSRGDRVAEGRLLSADGSWLVLRAEDGSVSTLSRAAVQELRLARPPAGLSLKPTLEAVIAGARRGRADLRLSYLTGGLTWNAEHVVVIRGERRAEWSAAVTVDNTTGRDYVDADLKLVAGEPHRQAPKALPYQRGVAMEMSAAAAAPDLGEQSFAEYHLYTLDRPATLRDRESQSLSMIEPREVAVAPRYYYLGGDPSGVSRQVELTNTRQAGLGVPLPGGRVRFYQADPSGALQFVGETRIQHTPEGEKLTLDVGRAFDLAAERREVASRRISNREREYTVEIKLRNRKSTGVTIVAAERVAGDTEILNNTHEFVRKDANTVEFSVPVAAGKEVVVRYTARVRY